MKQMYSKEEIEKINENALTYGHTIGIHAETVQGESADIYFKYTGNRKEPFFKDIHNASETMNTLAKLFYAGFFEFVDGTYYDTESNLDIANIIMKSISNDTFKFIACYADYDEGHQVGATMFEGLSTSFETILYSCYDINGNEIFYHEV